MNQKVFMPANILIPKVQNMTAWSVVACDQYTSQPDYWNRVEEIVKDLPSSYHVVFPEIYLKSDGFSEKIKSINSTMQKYLADNIFTEYKDTYIYLERTLKNGIVRKGIVGMVDLEKYNYDKGSQSEIRATEGTVLERIPPRVCIREDAAIELPHVMLLLDDKKKEIIESLAAQKQNFPVAYDFELMQESGSIKGYALPHDVCDDIDSKIAKLTSIDSFEKRYGVKDCGNLAFAVGDGNHSLATAKRCYANLKERIGEDAAAAHPSRYALVELVNLHDDSLQFEAIHRVAFQVNAKDIMEEFAKKFKLSTSPVDGAQEVTVVIENESKTYYITNPTFNLAVGSVQEFIDEYLIAHHGAVDYIHGKDVVLSLCKESGGVGFILPKMDKNDLFKTVILDGALPRKTFSMGEACDKRFYLEARKIAE